MKKITHVGMVVNHNYGSPYSYSVELRESALYWISDKGVKYKKVSGVPAGASNWDQNRLKLSSVKPKE